MGFRLFILKCLKGTAFNDKAVSPFSFYNVKLIFILTILWLNRLNGWYLEVVKLRSNC